MIRVYRPTNLRKGKAYPERTRSVHGGVPVIKIQGKWVRDTERIRGDKKAEEKKEPSYNEAVDAASDWEFIPPAALPEDVVLSTGDEAVDVPKEYIKGGAKIGGRLFVAHSRLQPTVDGSYKWVKDELTLTNVDTGLAIPKYWVKDRYYDPGDPKSAAKFIKRNFEEIEKRGMQNELEDKIANNELPEKTASGPFPTTADHYMDDKETKEAIEKIENMVDKWGLTDHQIEYWASYHDTYLPDVLRENQDFSPNTWKVAIDWNIGPNALEDLRDAASVAYSYDVDLDGLWQYKEDVGVSIDEIGNSINAIKESGGTDQDISDALQYAIDKGKAAGTLLDAYQSATGNVFDSDEDEEGPDAEGYTTDKGIFIPDDMVGKEINGAPIDESEIESLTWWSQGKLVKFTRDHIRVKDGSLTPDKAVYYEPQYRPQESQSEINQIQSTFDNMSRFTGMPTLYRGTKTDYEELDVRVGDEIPFGCGSCSKLESSTREFSGGSGYTIQIDVDAEHESEGLYGVDIDAMHYLPGSTKWEQYNDVDYGDEEEVALRCSHLRVKEIDTNKRRLVVEPVYRGMQLNKATLLEEDQSRIYAIMQAMDETFNMSLAEQREKYGSSDQQSGTME